MVQPLVFNIQKFSVHDGPGIRTTIFFKGCPLACPWCHNPESQSFLPEVMHGEDGRDETVGTYYSVADLVRRAAQDQIFYEQSGGGVTLSGGEVMAQPMDYVRNLVHSLKDEGISVGIDTSGAVPFAAFEKVLGDTDFFLYDMKLFSGAKHRKYIGADNARILENLERLSRAGAVLYLRLIMVDGVNMNLAEDIDPFLDWLQARDIRAETVHLLPYHTLGRQKYAALQREARLFRVPAAAALEKVRQRFQAVGYDAVIGG